VVAWLLPAAMTALAVAIVLRAPGAKVTAPIGMLAMIPLPMPWGGLALGLLAGATVCLPGALGEELGWRGLLRTELEPLGFWRSSLVVGLLWAGWHLPAVFLGGLAGGTIVGALGLTLLLLLATPIAMALCRRGGSVLPAALMHSSGSGMLAGGALVKGGHGVLPVIAPLVPVVICLLILVVFPRLRGDPVQVLKQTRT
jgi:membrane protease YdiL (CAAX protease family)